MALGTALGAGDHAVSGPAAPPHPAAAGRMARGLSHAPDAVTFQNVGKSEFTEGFYRFDESTPDLASEI